MTTTYEMTQFLCERQDSNISLTIPRRVTASLAFTCINVVWSCTNVRTAKVANYVKKVASLAKERPIYAKQVMFYVETRETKRSKRWWSPEETMFADPHFKMLQLFFNWIQFVVCEVRPLGQCPKLNNLGFAEVGLRFWKGWRLGRWGGSHDDPVDASPPRSHEMSSK